MSKAVAFTTEGITNPWTGFSEGKKKHSLCIILQNIVIKWYKGVLIVLSSKNPLLSDQ